MISGTLKNGNVVAPINGKLNGDQITFTAGGTQYTGRVNGNAMEGNAGGSKWSATRAGKVGQEAEAGFSVNAAITNLPATQRKKRTPSECASFFLMQFASAYGMRLFTGDLILQKLRR